MQLRAHATMNYQKMGKPALSACPSRGNRPLPLLDAACGPEIVFTEPNPKIYTNLSLLIIHIAVCARNCVWPLPIGCEPEKK